MDWCSYFRLQDGQQFAQILNALQQECRNDGYTPYAPVAILVNGNQINAAGHYKLSQPHDPNWLTFLGTITAQQHLTNQLGRGHSAIILVEHAAHLYFLTFGSAHSIAKRFNIESRFGKIALSNGKFQNEVRLVQGQTHGHASKTRVEKRGRGGQLGELELPRRANMASKIAAKLSFGGVEHIAEGSGSIRTVAPIDSQDLVAKIEQLERWWNGGIENDPALAALDRITDLRHEPHTVMLLDVVRVQAIRAGNLADFSLCLDDDELWDAISLDYFVNRQRLPLGVPDEQHIFGALANLPAATDPLSVRYKATVPTRNSSVEGRLANNLAYETQIPHDPSHYIFESGAWFRANAQWTQQVGQDIGALIAQSVNLLAGVQLPVALNSREREDAYINRLMRNPAVNGRCHQMHRVNRPAGIPNVEPYDICIDGNILLFMKHGTDRACCGDVCQQVMDAVNAMTDINPNYLNWVNKQIKSRGWQLNVNRGNNLIFCAVLISGNPLRGPDQFSLRAKDALSGHLRDVEGRGFRAAVLVV